MRGAFLQNRSFTRIATVAILILGTAAGCAPYSVKPASSTSSTAPTPVQNAPGAVSPQLVKMMARRLGYRPMRLFCRGSYPYQGGTSLYQGARATCLYHGARGYRPVVLYCKIEVPIGTSLAGNTCIDEDHLRWEWQARQF